MRLIFLDIDGVLTSKMSNTFIFECPGENYDFNPYCVECLKYILDTIPDLKVVISSSWRNYPDNHIMIGRTNGETYKSLIPKIKELLGDRLIGHATEAEKLDGKSNKYDAICDYLNSDPDILDFVVLDDDPTQGLQGFGEQFVKISSTTGLTLQDCKKVIDYFNS